MARANLINVGRPSRDHFGLRTLRPVLSAEPRVADGLGQHLAQLSLRLRRLPRKARFLPLGYGHYVGMPEGEVNAAGTANQGQPTQLF
jgi:hypothetical protein